MANPVTSVGTTTTPATSVETSSDRLDTEIQEARENAVADFSEFLTLLTAQLKNQDPLQPLDSTQFVEQLASFSAVEQQVGTNEKLSRLVAQGEAEEVGRLGTWIGQTVDARNALYQLGSDGLTIDVPAQAGAISAEAIITDTDGDTVARVPIEDMSVPFVWDGQKEGDKRAASGLYSVAFEYKTESGDTLRSDTDASGIVTEARIDEDGPLLILDNGARVRPEDISALRLAEEANATDSAEASESDNAAATAA